MAASENSWQDVDDFIVAKLGLDDEVLRAALAANTAGGLPAIDVSNTQGRMLELLTRMSGARRILEVGTLGGYSTICLARAAGADGRVVTLELKPEYAEVAAANIARAGLAGIVDIRVGPAADSLEALIAERPEPFDFVFIDADKQNNAVYFRHALELARPGGTIIVDNVVRGGTLADSTAGDPGTKGSHELHDLIAAEPRVSATTIQTVGSKGWDGFTLAVVASGTTTG